MKRARRSSPLLYAALFAAACGRTPPVPPEKNPDPSAAAKFAAAPVAGVDATAAAPSTAVVFSDVSAVSGLKLKNVNGDVKTKPTILESLGQGAAVLDYDGDGDLDVFICNGDTLRGKPEGAEPRCALYRQDSPFRFTDVSSEAGLAVRGWYQGAYAADVDGDGRTDLFLTAFGGSRLFLNRGDGTFADRTPAWTAAVGGWTSGAAFFDADGDGDLDLYIARYVAFDLEKPPQGGNPCNWKGLAVACGPHGLVPEADVFLRNEGDRFVDSTRGSGFDRAKPSYGLGVVTFDFDGDGDQDVYVANDSMANFLFENRGGTFVESASELGCDLGEGGRAQAGMGVDAADVDLDGRPDVFVTNFDEDVNTLYRNECDARIRAFFNATGASGLGPPSFRKMGWGTRIFDADGDGSLDIVVANGHIYPQVDDAGMETSFRQTNQFFRNLGTDSRGLVRFAPLPAGPFFKSERSSRGLLTADFDDDLDLDLLVVEMDDPPSLGRNDTSGGYGRIGVEFRGAGRNTGALGAKLVVEDDRGVKRTYERSFGGGFYSTSDPRIVATFGGAGLVRATVTFAGGRKVEIPPAFSGGYVIVDETLGTAVPRRKNAK